MAIGYEWLDFNPPVIALQGASTFAPANSLFAFQKAFEAGAKWVATEVKLTSDGTPILIHDDALEIATNGSGNVADLDWSDIEKLDAGSRFGPEFSQTKICQLKDLMAFALRVQMRVCLELKPSPGRTQATSIVTLIEAAKYWPEEAPVPLIASEDVEALVIAAQLHPGWPRGLMLKEWREDWKELASLTQATTLHIDADLLTPERIGLMRQTHMPILAYTVDEGERARNLLQLGVRAVFTHAPAEILKAL